MRERIRSERAGPVPEVSGTSSVRAPKVATAMTLLADGGRA